MIEIKCGFDSAPGSPGAPLLVLYGPTLRVDVGFDPAYKADGKSLPTPGVTEVPALVDTGASESCIDSMLATHLKLPIVDRRPVSCAHGSQEVNMYMAQVHVKALNFTLYGAFAGVHLTAGGQVHAVLIGRTFLQHFTMVYEGRTGTVTISSP